MPKIAITATGVNELRASLDGWEADVTNLKGPLTSLLQQVIRPHIGQAFADSGPGWKALSPAYAKWKAIHYAGMPILVRTGKMRTALTGGVGSAFTVTENSLTIDPSQAVPYWKWHETGAGKLPKRSMLQFSDQAQVEMGDTLLKWLSDSAHKYGFVVAT
jgi:hypothetical protein